MKFLIIGILLLNTVLCLPLINSRTIADRSGQIGRSRTLNVNAFDILGLFGKRGGFLIPIIQNTIGNGNGMSLQTGITLLNNLFNGFAETGGANGGGLLGLNLI